MLRNKAQRTDEFRAFLDLVKAEAPTSYLEIGVQRGITFRSIGQVLMPGSLMVGVDMPGARWGVKDGTGPGLIKDAVRDLREFGHDARIIWGDSQDPANVEAVRQLGPYDLVFIDGDHSPEGVRADWEHYGAMGSVVAFHDIDTPAKPGITSEWLAEYGVHLLWPELKKRYNHVEIIGSERGMGIGVLWRE